jgi:hypothetical protein
MLYLSSAASSPAIREAMRAGEIGLLITPADKRAPDSYPVWAADNGCFGKHYDEAAWWEWLTLHAPHADRCLFAVAPDVVADAAATLERSAPWMPRIRALGYPVAFVAQNGQESLPVPWEAFDVLFIGGDTAWKLGSAAADLAALARARGKRVHVGRVNSLRRLRHAEAIGADTADGTFFAFGPDVNLGRYRGWAAVMDGAPMLPIGAP